jgi:hypothetical protein
MVREDTAAGLYAGERSGRSGLGAFARQMQSDQKRKLSDGSTITQRVAARSAERQLRQAQQPTSTNLERLGDSAAAAMTGVVAAIHTHDVAHQPEARTGMAVRQLPGSNRLAWLPRQTPPAHAKTIVAADANRAQLLATGYTIQDGSTPETLLIWRDVPTSRRTGLTQAGNIAFRASQPYADPPAVRVTTPIVPAASSDEAVYENAPSPPAAPTPATGRASIPTQTPRRGAI